MQIYETSVCYTPRLEAYPEKILGRTCVQSAVENLRLFGEVVGGLYGREHSLDGEEGGQVGSVGRDDDEREEPPRTAYYPPRHRPDQHHQVIEHRISP